MNFSFNIFTYLLIIKLYIIIWNSFNIIFIFIYKNIKREYFKKKFNPFHCLHRTISIFFTIFTFLITFKVANIIQERLLNKIYKLLVLDILLDKRNSLIVLIRASKFLFMDNNGLLLIKINTFKINIKTFF